MPMKTTFDLPEALVHEVKRIARQRGTTARAIVQQALMRVVEEDRAGDEKFVLPDMSAGGWNELIESAPGLSLQELINGTYEEAGRG